MPRTTSQDQVGGTQVAEVIYYCRGTLILTETGEVPVETLRPGDRVITRSGTPQPVLWLGTLSFGSAHVTHGGLLPQAARPIRIAAGAFGPGTPHTDLRVSPNHALYHDGVLIPAFCLVNGATIRPEPVLPAHHLVLANGMPSESWIDIGNRRFFDDAPVTACRTGPVGGASKPATAHHGAGRTAPPPCRPGPGMSWQPSRMPEPTLLRRARPRRTGGRCPATSDGPPAGKARTAESRGRNRTMCRPAWQDPAHLPPNLCHPGA